VTIVDIIVKILLFFIVFYGAIILTAVVSKKIRESLKDKEKDINDKK